MAQLKGYRAVVSLVALALLGLAGDDRGATLIGRRFRRNNNSGDRERGQAYIEFVLVLPLFLIVIAGVVGFGQMLYTKLALSGAAWSGSRHAIATLSQTRGVNQAYQGVRYALDGFGLNPDRAQAQVSVWGAWGRGTQIRTRVCYTVPSPPVPFGQVLAPQQVCASQTLPVYRWKSKW